MIAVYRKGSSVIMYKDAALRTYQYYVNPDWPGSCVASYPPIFYFSLYFLQEEYMQVRVCQVRGSCISLRLGVNCV
jgi:hypothetical protein